MIAVCMHVQVRTNDNKVIFLNVSARYKHTSMSDSKAKANWKAKRPTIIK